MAHKQSRHVRKLTVIGSSAAGFRPGLLRFGSTYSLEGCMRTTSLSMLEVALLDIELAEGESTGAAWAGKAAVLLGSRG